MTTALPCMVVPIDKGDMLGTLLQVALSARSTVCQCVWRPTRGTSWHLFSRTRI